MSRKSRIKIYDRNETNDIRYRGPLSYRHLQIMGWIAVSFLVLNRLIDFGITIDPNQPGWVLSLNSAVSVLSQFTLPLFLFANFAILLDGKKPFRYNTDLHKALLMSFETCPFLAHNAAFEDSWFMLHLPGYAEARKAGTICPIDTRDICRRIDPDVRTLPHDAKPAALESWAKRRGTLKAHEKERHLGLDDVDLMIRTVEAEFQERNMFAET